MIENKSTSVKELDSVLKFHNYVVESIEFNTNLEFEEDSPVNIEFNIQRNIEYQDDEAGNITALVNLKVNIFDNAIEQNYPFNMKVSLTGIFEINKEVGIEERISLAEGNAVAILFPYLRSLVSTYTANANVSPLILPPINVIKLIEAQKQK